MPCSAPEANPGARAAVLAIPQAAPGTDAGFAQRLQKRRHALQLAFFALVLLAPGLNLLRLDLNEAQLWVLGQRWTLGALSAQRGEMDAAEASLAIVLRGMLPLLLVAGTVLAVAWRWGRLYCGWLCPHFTMVERLNDLLHRACGRYSVWDRQATPVAGQTPQRRWWPLFAFACVTLGFTWAVTLLSYLLPPAEIWGNLLRGEPTANQARFLAIGTTVFSLEFAFARHLFCRFGCAVGLFQSLAWMANPRALVVAFDRRRAAECRDCQTATGPRGDACEIDCPMRLQPRREKRWMFSCVQCARCLSQCEQSHARATTAPQLQWTVGADALRESLRQRRAAADRATATADRV